MLGKPILKSPTKKGTSSPIEVREGSEDLLKECHRIERGESSLVVVLKVPKAWLKRITPKSASIKQVDQIMRERQILEYKTLALREDRERRHAQRSSPILEPSPVASPKKKKVSFDVKRSG